jgi:hypothetical protein
MANELFCEARTAKILLRAYANAQSVCARERDNRDTIALPIAGENAPHE